MSDPKTVRDKKNEIGETKKELEIIENIKEISRDEEYKDIEWNLTELKNHYIEEKKDVNKTSDLTTQQKSEALSDLDMKIKTIHKISKEHMDEQTSEIEDTTGPSFLDDID